MYRTEVYAALNDKELEAGQEVMIYTLPAVSVDAGIAIVKDQMCYEAAKDFPNGKYLWAYIVDGNDNIVRFVENKAGH